MRWRLTGAELLDRSRRRSAAIGSPRSPIWRSWPPNIAERWACGSRDEELLATVMSYVERCSLLLSSITASTSPARRVVSAARSCARAPRRGHCNEPRAARNRWRARLPDLSLEERDAVIVRQPRTLGRRVFRAHRRECRTRRRNLPAARRHPIGIGTCRCARKAALTAAAHGAIERTLPITRRAATRARCRANRRCEPRSTGASICSTSLRARSFQVGDLRGRLGR